MLKTDILFPTLAVLISGYFLIGSSFNVHENVKGMSPLNI